MSSLVVTRDDQLIETIQAAAAAVNVTVQITGNSELIRRSWTQADLVLIGVDLASLVIGMALPIRNGVHLAGFDSPSLLAWSVPLAAPAMLLPDQSGFLTSVLAKPQLDYEQNAKTVRVIGGSGGVGATTLAAGLAQQAVNAGESAALVELDHFGGGIDLLFGAEHSPGWRWNDLASAAGHVGDLRGQLPNSSGVDLVTINHQNAGLPKTDAINAVVRSLARTHDWVILDCGVANADLPTQSALSLIVVAAEVRSVMSARSRIAEFGLENADLVVRTSSDWALDAELVSQSLGMPIAGVIRQDRRIGQAAKVGKPPGYANNPRFSRTCKKLLEGLAQ